MSRVFIIASFLMLLTPVFARASIVTYDFEVNGGASGPLANVTAEGTLSFDSDSLVTNTVSPPNILTSLSFNWNGTTFDATTANTGWLTLVQGFIDLSFGTNCTPNSCTWNTAAPNDWYIDLQFHQGLGGVASGTIDYTVGSIGNLYSGLVTAQPVPLAGTAWLMLIGFGALAPFARRERSEMRRVF